MAPEALTLKQYSEKSEVWSYGVVCHEVWTRTDPYPDLTPVQVLAMVGQRDSKLSAPEGPTMFSALAEECLSWEAADRPSFNEICSRLARVEA
jgi:protein tyrosine kinase 6